MGLPLNVVRNLLQELDIMLNKVIIYRQGKTIYGFGYVKDQLMLCYSGLRWFCQ